MQPSSAIGEAPQKFLLQIEELQRQIGAAHSKSAELLAALWRQPDSVDLRNQYIKSEAEKNRILEEHKQRASLYTSWRKNVFKNEDMKKTMKLLKKEAGLKKKGRDKVYSAMFCDEKLYQVYLDQMKGWDAQSRSQWLCELLMEWYDGDIEDVIDFIRLPPAANMAEEIKKMLTMEAGLTKRGRKVVRRMMKNDEELSRYYVAQARFRDEQTCRQWLLDQLIMELDGNIGRVVDFRALLGDEMDEEIKNALEMEECLTEDGRNVVWDMIKDDDGLSQRYLAQAWCRDERQRGQWLWELLVQKYGVVEELVDFVRLMPEWNGTNA